MIFVCPFVHCKALRTAMYKRYINSIIITIIIIIIIIQLTHSVEVNNFLSILSRSYSLISDLS